MAGDEGRLRLVILDWAGTTVDYGCYAPTVAFVEAFKSMGVAISVAEARGPMGVGKRDHIRAIVEAPGVADRWREAHGAACTEADVDAMYERFKPLQTACLSRYARLVPGTVDAVAALRAKGLRIGTTTGYFTEATEIVRKEAEGQGYVPDATVCATDVPAGRPAPWMVFRNMELTGVYPASSVVKVGDTVPDIGEGLNAGAWTVGVSQTGNEVGSSEAELEALPAEERKARIAGAERVLREAGAHAVIPSVARLPEAVEALERRMAQGERP